MTKNNILSRFRPWQSEFSHHYACWANNHNGWAKMKRLNRRLAKRKFARFDLVDHADALFKDQRSEEADA